MENRLNLVVFETDPIASYKKIMPVYKLISNYIAKSSRTVLLESSSIGIE